MAFLLGLLGGAGGAGALGSLGGAAEAATTAAPAVGMASGGGGGGKHGKGVGAPPASSPGLLPPNPGSLPSPGALGGGATGPPTLGVGGTGAGTGAGRGPLLPTSPTPSLGELTAIPELTTPGSASGLTMGTLPGGLSSPFAPPGLDTSGPAAGPNPLTQFFKSRYGFGDGGGMGGNPMLALMKQIVDRRRQSTPPPLGG